MMWQMVKVGALIEKTVSINPSIKFPDSFFKYIDVSSVNNETLQIEKTQTILGSDAPSRARRQVQKGDVIFATVRPTLKRVAIVNNELDGQICSTGYIILRAKRDLIDNKFLFYLISSSETLKYMEAVQTGASYPAVTDKQVKEYKIPLPPLPEQQRIVDNLDSAFDDIDKTISNANKSLTNLQLILPKYLQDIFSMKENFFSGTISDCCSIKSGKTVNKNLEKDSGDIPYLKVADMNIKENEIEITTSTRFLNYENITKSNIIEKGVTIFPKRGGAIATNKKRITSTEVALDLNIMAVKPKQGLNPKLLFYYFLSIDLGHLGSGSSVPQINNYDIEPLKIHFPTDSYVQKILVEKTDHLTNNLNKLEAIYSTKIQKLIALKSVILTAELQH